MRTKRNLNVSFSKARESTTTRVSVPITWLKDMGISPEERTLEVEYDSENKTIIMRKKI